MKYYLAIDLGATSGRHIVGYKDEKNELILDEIYRFNTGVEHLDGHLVWNIDRLFKEIKEGIKIAFKKYYQLESLSIDTWGVDYVLLKGDEVVKPCYAYRDSRTKDDIDEVHSIVPFKELYASAGIQFQSFNTIYQLYDDLKHNRLDGVTDFLMLPEFFSYLLTGVKKKEYTDATTGGFVNTKTLQFDKQMLEKLGLPLSIFKELSLPGTYVGEIKDDLKEELGGSCKVILCPSHDTASAYEAIDSTDTDIVLSSGTWSLIGTKIKKASTSNESCATNFTNEGGVGYFRYLKNIMGMWLINEIQKKYDYPITKIVELATNSDGFELFDVNDESLFAPDDMEIAINNLLEKYDGEHLVDHEYLFCSIYHSLAKSYKNAIKQIENNLGTIFKNVYIVGGGAKNQYLNELIKTYTVKNVIALPIEATVIGNLKTQMK